MTPIQLRKGLCRTYEPAKEQAEAYRQNYLSDAGRFTISLRRFYTVNYQERNNWQHLTSCVRGHGNVEGFTGQQLATCNFGQLFMGFLQTRDSKLTNVFEVEVYKAWMENTREAAPALHGDYLLHIRVHAINGHDRLTKLYITSFVVTCRKYFIQFEGVKRLLADVVQDNAPANSIFKDAGFIPHTTISYPRQPLLNRYIREK